MKFLTHNVINLILNILDKGRDILAGQNMELSLQVSDTVNLFNIYRIGIY